MNLFEGWKAGIAEAGLLRETRPIRGPHGRLIRIGGRELLNFASNDYLGLADDPRPAAAARGALDRLGWGSGASRLLSGTNELHERLEERLAAFHGAGAALLFGSGYLANIGVLPVLAGEGTVLFSDALNHASLIDAARLSKAEVRIYPHADPEALGRMLRAAGGRRVVATDGVFSMDGDLAPLDRILALLDRDDDILYVDDAHGTGVIGEGKGAAAHFGLADPRLVLMGTLSKALGGIGAFVVGPRELVDVLRSRARSFIFDTALPPPAAAAALAALEILEAEGRRLRAALHANCRRLASGLRALGFPADPSTPVFPVVLGTPERAMAAARRLEAAGIFAPGIRPPAVPAQACRLRLSVTAAHTAEDLDRLTEALAQES